jgi:penicillin amidase
VPVPGDGRYEWDGYLPIKALPRVLNPEKGFFNTSNNYLIPAGWPYKNALHYLWADPYRADSVEEFLRSGRRFSVADMIQLQNNDLSIPARQLVPLLRDLDFTKPAAAQAALRLLRWNDVLDRDSPEAAIYEMWQRHMLADIRTVFVPKEARDYIGNPEMSKAIAWLTAPDGRFGADPVAGRNAFLEKTLDIALDRLTLLLGSDIDKWKLGGFHRATILHPLSSALKPELREVFDVGKLGRGGDSYTDHSHRRDRQPDLRRLLQDHRRHRGLGQFGRLE